MNNYIILHGTGGSPKENWFPWLKSEITKRGYNCELKQFPIGLGKQTYDSWSKVFSKYNINKNTIIIAHSFASIFVVKYITEKQLKIAKLISVAGFNSDGNSAEINEINKTFLLPNIVGFENLCNERICIYSDNDPYLPFVAQDSFAHDIKAKKLIIKGGMHLNTESGYTKLEKILEYL